MVVLVSEGDEGRSEGFFDIACDVDSGCNALSVLKMFMPDASTTNEGMGSPASFIIEPGIDTMWQSPHSISGTIYERAPGSFRISFKSSISTILQVVAVSWFLLASLAMLGYLSALALDIDQVIEIVQDEIQYFISLAISGLVSGVILYMWFVSPAGSPRQLLYRRLGVRA